jgi:predicted Rossmann fold flavoprotein
VTVSPGTRIHRVARTGDGFVLDTSTGPLHASAVVMATGGLSLPKTGSDGTGLQIARTLGHSLVPTTPALAPLTVRDGFAASLSGVAHDAELTLRAGGRVVERITGAMLWTHFGVSGPAALDMSRHFLRVQLEGREPSITLSFQPGASFETVDTMLARLASERPRLVVQNALAEIVPASVAAALVSYVAIDPATKLASLARDARRAISHALTGFPLDVTGSRGYNYAEATAGGVALDEIDPASMESRKCPGLYLVGEMLDVDGRLGGFNFQWAWSSGRTAAEGLARRFGSRS